MPSLLPAKYFEKMSITMFPNESWTGIRMFMAIPRSNEMQKIRKNTLNV